MKILQNWREGSIQEAGDLYEGWEAPEKLDDLDAIFEAPVNDPFYGHLGIEDRGDQYKIDLKKAGGPGNIKVKMKCGEGIGAPFQFRIEARDTVKKSRITRFINQENEAEVEIPTEGHDSIFLFIGNDTVGGYHLMNSYQLEVIVE